MKIWQLEPKLYQNIKNLSLISKAKYNFGKIKQKKEAKNLQLLISFILKWNNNLTRFLKSTEILKKITEVQIINILR